MFSSKEVRKYFSSKEKTHFRLKTLKPCISALLRTKSVHKLRKIENIFIFDVLLVVQTRTLAHLQEFGLYDLVNALITMF